MTSPLSIDSTITLSNGYQIPQLGFGCYRSAPRNACQSVTYALEAGYRHIDSAQMYRNEAQVALSIRSSPLPRSSIFLTTKLGFTNYIPSRLQESLGKINLGYVDLFLVHSPGKEGREGRVRMWSGLEELVREGTVRSIGVSNYGVKHLEEMKEYASILPVINQIELHPWCQQPLITSYCRAHSIVLEAYSPLVQGTKAEDPVLLEIAGEVGRSWAQVLVRWSLQRGFIPLPKSDTPERIRENSQVFDFELSEAQMGRLNALDGDEHVCWNPTTAD